MYFNNQYVKNMTKKDAIKIFEGKDVRSVWDAEAEKWYISIVDVMSVLTNSVDGRKYWNKLKQRLREEGNESVTNCHQLKLLAADGKKYLTDIITYGYFFLKKTFIGTPVKSNCSLSLFSINLL